MYAYMFIFLFQDNTPIYYPSPNVSRPANQLTEEEQVKIAQRMGLIQHLPTGSYDGCKKNRE
jgi:E3 ubiquitin-protein ligase RNF11